MLAEWVNKANISIRNKKHYKHYKKSYIKKKLLWIGPYGPEQSDAAVNYRNLFHPLCVCVCSESPVTVTEYENLQECFFTSIVGRWFTRPGLEGKLMMKPSHQCGVYKHGGHKFGFLHWSRWIKSVRAVFSVFRHLMNDHRRFMVKFVWCHRILATSLLLMVPGKNENMLQYNGTIFETNSDAEWWFSSTVSK